jgi:hypothetical protein
LKYIIFVIIFLLYVALDAKAQLRPSESQYLIEKGALINPGFEQGKKGWTLVNGTFALGNTSLLAKHASVSVSGEVLNFSQFTTNMDRLCRSTSGCNMPN